jgi:hypothetical protein
MMPMPVRLGLTWLRKKEEFEATLGYTARSFLTQNKTNSKI